MRPNPINKFFKAIRELEKTANTLSRQRKDRGDSKEYWPFTSSYEANPKDCFKRKDGLWQLKKKINTHMPHGGSTVIFIWRVFPNCCYAGRPCYGYDSAEEFRQKSETEKIMLVENGYEYVWTWDEVTMPTRTNWGMHKGPCFFQLRKDGKILVEADSKTAFKRLCHKEFNFPLAEPKEKRKYTIETEKAIRILEKHYGHSAHCEEQVQIFYKPCDTLHYWDGSNSWNGYYRPARDKVAQQIKSLVDGYKNMFKSIDMTKVRFQQIADYYRAKIMFNETLDILA